MVLRALRRIGGYCWKGRREEAQTSTLVAKEGGYPTVRGSRGGVSENSPSTMRGRRNRNNADAFKREERSFPFSCGGYG